MKFILIACLCLLNTVSRAQFSVGAVQYSIIPPDKFTQLNPGWVLMDGRSITGSRLASDAGINTLPDARGLFIRGMNESRGADSGDTEGNRGVGNFQSDAFQAHAHNFNYAWHKAFGWTRLTGGDVNVYWGDATVSGTTANASSASETRPRNIALYTYIKIN